MVASLFTATLNDSRCRITAALYSALWDFLLTSSEAEIAEVHEQK
jgi:hypothetical protein